jgi:cytochrome c peroxidase
MGGSAERTAQLIATDPALSLAYRAAFGTRSQAGTAETVLVDAAKALAAFQETITSERSAFDDFRDAIARGDAAGIAKYPIRAQRGLRLFIGRGSCTACHLGPRFSNDEFADIGIPFFTASAAVDPGRYGGITRLKASPFNLLGRYSDDPARSGAWSTAQVDQQHRNWGEFKVPSLRGVRHTAPYMHNGRLPTLEAVVRHYSDLDESRLHTHGERILKPLGLDEAAIADLVAFLETL